MRKQHNPRRRRLIILVGLPLALLGIAGVAFALYMLTASTTGTLTGRSLAVKWTSVTGGSATGTDVTSTTATPGSGTAATCTIARADTNGSAVDIRVSGYPGDTCTVYGKLMVTGSEEARVTGLAMTLPTGWRAKLVPDATCGLQIGTTAKAVGIIITVGPNGGSGSLAATDGVTLSPLSQTAGQTITCPELVGQ